MEARAVLSQPKVPAQDPGAVDKDREKRVALLHVGDPLVQDHWPYYLAQGWVLKLPIATKI